MANPYNTTRDSFSVNTLIDGDMPSTAWIRRPISEAIQLAAVIRKARETAAFNTNKSDRRKSPI
jgi:hypothetical protein